MCNEVNWRLEVIARLDYYIILFSQFMFLPQTIMCPSSNLSTDFKESFCLNFRDLIIKMLCLHI